VPPGVQHYSTLARGEKAYYSITVPRPPILYEHIDVNLVPTAGDVDMYITLDPNVVPGPEPGHWQYKSESHTSEDYDIIHRSDNYYIDHCSGATCVVFVMVTPAPWTLFANNTFYISATPNSQNLQLKDGVALVDHAMSGTWNYYVFTLLQDPGADAEVLISLTPYAGDPDCFASTSIPRPSASQHDPGKASRRTSRDVIRYYDTDPNWCAGFPCSFYIGVTAFASNSTFAIMATLRSNNTISLVDGQTVYQFVQRSEDLQFGYTIPSEKNIMEVVVSPVYGDPDL